MPFYWRTGEITYLDKLERFAALVASAERERIKQANAPEIERINAYIKEALAQREQDGQCKHCTDGCPACYARKLPTQEPVAWNVVDPTGKIVATEMNSVRGWARIEGYKPTVEGLLGFHEQGWRVVPTTPPQRKPLSDEEVHDAVRESDLDWHQGWTLDNDEPNRFISLARAIEAAHGIKGEA